MLSEPQKPESIDLTKDEIYKLIKDFKKDEVE